MDDGDKFKLLTPPNLLAAKVTTDGPNAAAMLARAERAVAELRRDYEAWAEQELGRLERLFERVSESPNTGTDGLRQIYQVAHDMKGQGTTFGYPLVTAIAASLCRFTESPGLAGANKVAVIGAHIDALKSVIRNRVAGGGGELGREIVAGLRAAVSKHAR